MKWYASQSTGRSSGSQLPGDENREPKSRIVSAPPSWQQKTGKRAFRPRLSGIHTAGGAAALVPSHKSSTGLEHNPYGGIEGTRLSHVHEEPHNATSERGSRGRQMNDNDMKRDETSPRQIPVEGKGIMVISITILDLMIQSQAISHFSDWLNPTDVR